jgi:hypothetical protein
VGGCIIKGGGSAKEKINAKGAELIRGDGRV